MLECDQYHGPPSEHSMKLLQGGGVPVCSYCQQGYLQLGGILGNKARCWQAQFTSAVGDFVKELEEGKATLQAEENRA